MQNVSLHSKHICIKFTREFSSINSCEIVSNYMNLDSSIAN